MRAVPGKSALVDDRERHRGSVGARGFDLLGGDFGEIGRVGGSEVGVLQPTAGERKPSRRMSPGSHREYRSRPVRIGGEPGQRSFRRKSNALRFAFRKRVAAQPADSAAQIADIHRALRNAKRPDHHVALGNRHRGFGQIRMRHAGFDDLESRTVLVGEQEQLVGARVEPGHLVRNVGHQTPGDFSGAHRLERCRVKGVLAFHAVGDYAEGVGAPGNYRDGGEIVFADVRVSRRAVTEDRTLGLWIGAGPVAIHLSFLVPRDARSNRGQLREAKVKEGAVVRQPGDGGVLRPRDALGEDLFRVDVHHLQHAVLRPPYRDAVGDELPVGRGVEVVDRVVLAFGGERLRIDEQALLAVEPAAHEEAAIVRPGRSLEIKDAATLEPDAGHRDPRVVERVDSRKQAAALRQTIQDGSCIVILRFEPSDHLGALGVLEPPVGIGDHRAEVLFLDVADRRLRKRRRGAVG